MQIGDGTPTRRLAVDLRINPLTLAFACRFVSIIKMIWRGGRSAMWASSFRTSFLVSVITIGFFGSCSGAYSGEMLPTMETYAKGRDWMVVTEVEPKTCKLFVGNTSRVLVFGAFRPEGILKYSVMIKDEKWNPPLKPAQYKIVNENRTILSMKGYGFKSEGPGGFAVVGLFNEKVLRTIFASKSLYVRSNVAPEIRYDFNGVDDAFRRYFDCLKDAGGAR